MKNLHASKVDSMKLKDNAMSRSPDSSHHGVVAVKVKETLRSWSLWVVWVSLGIWYGGERRRPVGWLAVLYCTYIHRYIRISPRKLRKIFYQTMLDWTEIFKSRAEKKNEEKKNTCRKKIGNGTCPFCLNMWFSFSLKLSTRRVYGRKNQSNEDIGRF